MSLNASIPNKNAGTSLANAASTNPLNTAKVGGNNALKNAFANAPKPNAAAKVNTPVNAPAVANTPAVGGKAKRKGSPKTGKRVAKRGGADLATPTIPPANAPAMNAKAVNTPVNVAKPANAPAVGGRSSKKGGALVDDLKNLAVPFAILLAKQGVENMYAKKKSATSKGSPKSASKTSSARRRATLSGGACATGCGMTGGNNAAQVKHNFSKIAADIDKFLAKY